MQKTLESFNSAKQKEKFVKFLSKKIAEYEPYAKEGITNQELNLLRTTGIRSVYPVYNGRPEIEGNDYPLVKKLNYILLYLIFYKINAGEQLNWLAQWNGDGGLDFGVIWGINKATNDVDVKLYNFCTKDAVGNKLPFEYYFEWQELNNPLRYMHTKRFDL